MKLVEDKVISDQHTLSCYQFHIHLNILVSIMKRPSVATQIIRHSETLVSVDSSVTNTPFVKILYPPSKPCFYIYFRKYTTCLMVSLMRTGHVSSFYHKTVYRWVTGGKTHTHTPFRKPYTNHPINNAYNPNFFTQNIKNM
jgi:hypothetical protein